MPDLAGVHEDKERLRDIALEWEGHHQIIGYDLTCEIRQDQGVVGDKEYRRGACLLYPGLMYT